MLRDSQNRAPTPKGGPMKGLREHLAVCVFHFACFFFPLRSHLLVEGKETRTAEQTHAESEKGDR